MPAKTDIVADFQPSNDESKLWRYMSLEKFKDLIESKELYLARVDNFDDKFEGTIPIAKKQFCQNTNLSIVKTMYTMESVSTKEYRKWLYINCWHLSEYESAAMWSIYGKENKAIAIETTYSTLRDILPNNTFMAKVKYIDYRKDFFRNTMPLNPFIYKRLSFDFEKEVRIFKHSKEIPNVNILEIPNHENEIKAERVPIDINKLIKKVYLDPFSKESFQDEIKNLCKDFNFDILKSDLYNDPIY